MVIDQKELDALKADAGPARTAAPASDELRRVLQMRVPLIAQLASRRLSVARIRRLSVGTILEFDRHVDAPLDLLVNNRAIARGEAVKVAENFGVRIMEIDDPATRVRSMGA